MKITSLDDYFITYCAGKPIYVINPEVLTSLTK